MTGVDFRTFATARCAIALLLLLTAWLVAPPAPRTSGAGAAGALQRALGPLRRPLASVLRLRAGFARQTGRAGESIGLQWSALHLDPDDTAAVAWLASEIATQIPLSDLTKADRRAASLAGIEVLRHARVLGNRDPALFDWEAFYWTERYAPRDANPGAREKAIDNALESLDAGVEALAEAGRSDPRLHGRAGLLHEERGALRAARGDRSGAAADFTRAAQHERLLAALGLAGAAARAEALESRAAAAESLPR